MPQLAIPDVPAAAPAVPRISRDEVAALYRRPLLALIEAAHAAHVQYHPEPEVQLCQLLSIKTGGCPEDCGYCPQSAHYKTGIKNEHLMELEPVLAQARQARDQGATRFCMGAAWRQVREGPEFDRVLSMVSEVSSMGLEVCCTLGMLTAAQAQRLAAAGLTAYNHNLDTSPEFYGQIIHTREYSDRLRTLEHVRDAGVQVCCGGILGLGESEEDRISLLHVLATLPSPPESVPVNALVPVEGTPLEARPAVPALELVRMIAAARLLMPRSKVRLSAGRLSLSPEAQALCFYAGANSIFVGERLLTTPNPEQDQDRALLRQLGLVPEPPYKSAPAPPALRSSAAAAEADTPSPLAGLESAWRTDLDRLEALQRRRNLHPPQGLDFCSNDYLGLARDSGVRRQIRDFLAVTEQIGAGASRLVAGEFTALGEFEAEFAAWRGTEAALFFPSGYAANTGLLACLAGADDLYFSDALNHASLIDGMRLSRAGKIQFPHNDLTALEELLQRHVTPGRRFIVVESLHSMEGDRAPLAGLAVLCRRYRALLVVDEAHATGLFGREGAGLTAGVELDDVLAASVHPCGKALGAAGALICGSRLLREHLINHARTLIYSTGPTPALMAQLRAALAIIRVEPDRARRVRQKALSLRRRLNHLPLADASSPNREPESPVISLLCGSDARALAVVEAMRRQGFEVRAIRPPTVPEGTARVRITVHAGQSETDIQNFADAMEKCFCAV